MRREIWLRRSIRPLTPRPCSLTPDGAIAQLGERLLCKQEVVGSIPSGSTSVTTRVALPRGGARDRSKVEEHGFRRSPSGGRLDIVKKGYA